MYVECYFAPEISVRLQRHSRTAVISYPGIMSLPHDRVRGAEHPSVAPAEILLTHTASAEAGAAASTVDPA